MKYYLDTEFDGHDGPLISLAIIREDDFGLYVVLQETAKDPWVVENVIPHLSAAGSIPLHMARDEFQEMFPAFFLGDEHPEVIADSPVDIYRLAHLLSTDGSGNWRPSRFPRFTFRVENVDCYPCELPGLVQYNAFCDAQALKHKLESLQKQ